MLAGNFGIGKSQISLVWHEPIAGEQRYKNKMNPQDTNLAPWIETLYRQQIFPGETLDSSNQTLRYLNASLQSKRLN